MSRIKGIFHSLKKKKSKDTRNQQTFNSETEGPADQNKTADTSIETDTTLASEMFSAFLDTQKQKFVETNPNKTVSMPTEPGGTATNRLPSSEQARVDRMKRLLKAAQKRVSELPNEPVKYKEKGLVSSKGPDCANISQTIPLQNRLTEKEGQSETSAKTEKYTVQTQILPQKNKIEQTVRIFNAAKEKIANQASPTKIPKTAAEPIQNTAILPPKNAPSQGVKGAKEITVQLPSGILPNKAIVQGTSSETNDQHQTETLQKPVLETPNIAHDNVATQKTDSDIDFEESVFDTFIKTQVTPFTTSKVKQGEGEGAEVSVRSTQDIPPVSGHEDRFEERVFDTFVETRVTPYTASTKEHVGNLSIDIVGNNAEEDKETKQRSATSAAIESFGIDLLKEHLDELSFLISQCMNDPLEREGRWTDMADLENRLDAHLKAIAQINNSTIDVILQLLDSDDALDLQCAVYASLSTNGDKAMPHVLRRLLSSEEARIESMTRAMMYARYPNITEQLLPIFSNERPELKKAVIKVAASRGNFPADQLSKVVHTRDTALLSFLRDDLVKLPDDHLSTAWYWMLKDPAAKQGAVLSMLQAGQRDAIYYLLNQLQEQEPPQPWVFECLALCGGRYAFEYLEGHAMKGVCPCEAITALGRLGNVAAVPTILLGLEHDDENVRVASGEALERITGAGLSDEPCESQKQDDAVDDEASEEPARICISKSHWQDWWREHHLAFSPGRFYRFGKDFQFSQCIDEIENENTPAKSRMAAHQELLIRAQMRTMLKLEWPVKVQQQAIHKLRIHWDRQKENYTPGMWYFAGQEMD